MKSSTFSDSLFKRRIARTRTGEEFKPSVMNNDFLDREFYQQDIFTRPDASPILPTETPLMIDNAPSENFSIALAKYIDRIVQKISGIGDDKKIESLNNLK